MQNVGRAPNRAYQSTIHAGQDESKDSLMLKMRAEKETLVHILCECPVLEKVRIHTLDFARMDPEQIEEVRLSRIVAFGKGAGLLNSPL